MEKVDECAVRQSSAALCDGGWKFPEDHKNFFFFMELTFWKATLKAGVHNRSFNMTLFEVAQVTSVWSLPWKTLRPWDQHLTPASSCTWEVQLTPHPLIIAHAISDFSLIWHPQKQQNGINRGEFKEVIHYSESKGVWLQGTLKSRIKRTKWPMMRLKPEPPIRWDFRR